LSFDFRFSFFHFFILSKKFICSFCLRRTTTNNERATTKSENEKGKSEKVKKEKAKSEKVNEKQNEK